MIGASSMEFYDGGSRKRALWTDLAEALFFQFLFHGGSRVGHARCRRNRLERRASDQR